MEFEFPRSTSPDPCSSIAVDDATSVWRVTLERRSLENSWARIFSQPFGEDDAPQLIGDHLNAILPAFGISTEVFAFLAASQRERLFQDIVDGRDPNIRAVAS